MPLVHQEVKQTMKCGGKENRAQRVEQVYLVAVCLSRQQYLNNYQIFPETFKTCMVTRW